jgi:hypothetical protein
MVDPIPAGSRLLAEDLSPWGTAINAALSGGVKVKTSDTTRNSTTTFADDPHLAGIAVAANTNYAVECSFVYNSAATPDFKYQFTVPSGTTFRGFTLLYHPSGVTVPATMNWIDCNSLTGGVTGMNGAAADVRCVVRGSISVGSTAGTMAFQWAQDISNAGNTIVRQGSWLEVLRAG